MLRYLSLLVCFVFSSTALGAANKEEGRLENCGVVMQEILDIPDNIPKELEIYGRSMTARTIVTGNRIRVPASGRNLVDVLEKNAPRNESKRSTQ
jgi:hypothetical protein